MRSDVAILGGGPAALVAARLLQQEGPEFILLDTRAVAEVTNRAGEAKASMPR